MTQYNDVKTLTDQLADLQRQIRQLQTQPRLISSSIDRGGVQSADYDGSGTGSTGTQGWFFGQDETTGVGYAVINKNLTSASVEVSGTWTPDAGYSFLAGWTGRYAIRKDIVHFASARVTRSAAALAVTAGTDFLFVTALPVAIRPVEHQEMPCTLLLGSNTPVVGRIAVFTDGNVYFRSAAAGTLGVGGANAIMVPPLVYPLF